MLEITWLGHSSFQFRLESGEVILIDPWIGNPKYPEGHKFDRVDAIAVTHGHFDHIASVPDLAKKFSAPVVCIYEIAQWLESKGVATASGMNKGGTQKVGPVAFTMTHALHSSSITDEGRVIYAGEACGYVLHVPDGRRLYFAGDTSVFSDMALIYQLYQPELAMLPIGDFYTMSPREAAVAIGMLKPRTLIPMHFGTFPALSGRPEALQQLIQEFPQTKIQTLEPGTPFHW